MKAYDVCTVHLVLFIIQTNKCTEYITSLSLSLSLSPYIYIYIYIYIYKQYFIYRKYSYMFQCICVFFRESFPDDADASKQVVVRTIYKILFIYTGMLISP